MNEDPAEAVAAPELAPEVPGPPPSGKRLVAMIEDDSREPPPGISERQAEASWAAVSCLWHPALLARVDTLPTVQGVEFANVPEPNDLRLIAEGAGARLPADYRDVAAGQGAILLDGAIDRQETARRVLARIDPEASAGDPADPIAADFFALGTARWWLRDLTLGMNHADCLDLEGLTRETLAGARAWSCGDGGAAAVRIRAAMELLAQARERFYPVDSYITDLVLLDPASPAGSLADSLDARAAFSILAPASAIENQATLDPDRMARLREAITEGWADVVGGTYSESDEGLLPIPSIAWQFRKGAEVYRRHLDDRNVETLASRRFALYPMRPQVARRFGLRFAIFVGFDAGTFPIPVESKKLWEAPDASHLESLTRPPIAADKAGEGVRLAWRMARSMKDDQVAVVSLAHWAGPGAGWYRDFRRVAAYAHVLGRWVTMGDFFHLSDRPFEMFGADLDPYVTPYLAQAVARQDPRPISGRSAHAKIRACLDGLIALDALGRALTSPPRQLDDDGPSPPPAPPAFDVCLAEEALETGRIDASANLYDRDLPAVLSRLAGAVAGTGTGGRPGFLVFNPTSVARRATVELPGASDGLASEGPLRAAQRMGVEMVGVVDLPAFGFAWVPRDAEPGRSAKPAGRAVAEGRTVRNETLEAEVDPATGGLRAVRLRGESTARIGQQLTILGLTGPDGAAAPSRMVSEAVEIEAAGPALASIVSRGSLVHPHDGRVLARFRQVVSLWDGRPTLEVVAAFTDVDPAWLASIAEADPWAYALACRWAWPDSQSTLRRTSLLGSYPTESPRPETPDAIEISTRRQRVTLLFGGRAHHRRHGPRMLDTLLIAGRESARSFRLGVTLDLEHASQAILDFLAPAPVVATLTGPPRTGPAGWLVSLDTKAAAIVSTEFFDHSADDRGWGLAFVLVETAGKPARCRLRLFRDPLSARQVDFQGELIMDLFPDGDAVPIDLTPHEMARVEVRLG